MNAPEGEWELASKSGGIGTAVYVVAPKEGEQSVHILSGAVYDRELSMFEMRQLIDQVVEEYEGQARVRFFLRDLEEKNG